MRCAVEVATRCDIERRPGLHDHEGADPHIPLEVDRAAHGHAMTNIRRRRSVLTLEVVRVRREGSDSIRIAHRAIEHVEAEKRKARVEPGIDVGNQLVLVVQPRAFHELHGPRMPPRKHAAALHVRIVSPRQRRIDVLRAEHMHSVRVRVRHREGDVRR